MSKTEYVNRTKALNVLQKIEKKRRGCNCSREAIRQADAMAYAQEVVRKIDPEDVIPVAWLEAWAVITDREEIMELILNDWKKDNEQKEETEALQKQKNTQA